MGGVRFTADAHYGGHHSKPCWPARPHFRVDCVGAPMRGTTPDARGTLPCFVSHLARCLHSPRRTGQPPSCRSSRSTPRTKMLCTVGGMADQTVTASSPLPERSPTLAAELPGLAARIDQLAGQARRAFEAMVKMIHFDHVLARTEETLIGFPKGTGGTLPKKFNAYGGDKAMPPKSSSEMRKDWIEATRGLSDELVRTTRIDMQRNTGGDRGNMRVLQLQLTNNKKRLAGACVRLPAEQSSQVTSAIVRDAFMKSQATLRVVEVKTTGKIEIGPHDFASTDEPETEPAAHPQRFVVGARDVAEASVGAGWRTCWSDSLSLGQGFHRETGGVAATAISYRPPAADPTWTAKLKGNITVATNSKEYTEMTTSGGSLSMEGWGASAEATLRDEANMKFKLNTVTGVVSMRYLSEKIDVINPANADQEVKLTGSAKTLLRTQGPIKFHDLHGSHFISGLTKGGSFVGSFAMEFESSESARDWKAELKADFESFGLRAGGSAEFEKKLDNIKECVKYQGQYTCVGWSTDHPPKLICSLADLATAHNQFDPSHGCNMEALLRRYEDLDDYRTTLAEYQGTDKVSFIKEENYGSISSALNVDYLRTNYLRRLLEGEGSDVLAAIHLRAVDTLKRIRNAVGLKAGISTVRANFHFLEVFMIKYEGDLNAKPNPEDVEAWEAGRALYLDLWCADDLERDLEAAAPPTVPRVPRNLGNGWTVDTSDGHLGFRYNGDQRLVLHSPHHPEHPDQVWVKRVGYIDTMLRDGDAVTIRSDRNGHRLQHSDTFQVRVAAANGAWDLPNPATFANANRGGWERLILEKL